MALVARADEGDGVGVAHRHAGHRAGRAGDHQRLLDAALAGGPGHRDLTPAAAAACPIATVTVRTATPPGCLDVADQAAGAGVDRERRPGEAAAVVQLLDDAAQPVAAHLGLAAVAV